MAITSDPGRQSDAIAEKLSLAAKMAETAKNGISENNARIIALNQKADRITNPTARAKVKAAIAGHVQRQAFIAGVYRTAAQKLNDVRVFVKDLLARAGITGVPGLGELGFLPAIPAAWVALLVAAGAVITAILTMNVVHAGAIAETSKIVDGYLKGQIPIDEATKAIAALDKQADQQADLLGLKKAFSTVGTIAVPLLLVIAGIVVLPQLMAAGRFGRPRAA